MPGTRLKEDLLDLDKGEIRGLWPERTMAGKSAGATLCSGRFLGGTKRFSNRSCMRMQSSNVTETSVARMVIDLGITPAGAESCIATAGWCLCCRVNRDPQRSTSILECLPLETLRGGVHMAELDASIRKAHTKQWKSPHRALTENLKTFLAACPSQNAIREPN
jgi:hypothetical protein